MLHPVYWLDNFVEDTTRFRFKAPISQQITIIKDLLVQFLEKSI